MGKVVHAIQDDYEAEFAWCYGCGRLNEDGLHVRSGWEGDQTVAYFLPDEKHMAIPGIIYGGIIASIVDCHGTGSASLALHRKNGFEPGDDEAPPRFVTASLHVDYFKPTPAKTTLKLVGKVEEVHPKRFKVTIEVFADDVVTAKGEIVAVVAPDSFRDAAK